MDKMPLVTEEMEREAIRKLAALQKRKTPIRAIKPIMSPTLEKEVMAAAVMFTSRQKWKEWGLDSIRKQGSAVLLYGPPGCGKTVIAEYLSKTVGHGIMRVNMADFGSENPGEGERKIRGIFAEAGRKRLTLFLDECEAILWDRSRAGSGAMWMVAIVDELLMQIAIYKNLIILATNMDQILDPALDRRLIAKILVGMPEADEREKLWRMKIGKKFPIQPTPIQFKKLATLQMTGANIETAIIRCASYAIQEKKTPTFDNLYRTAQQYGLAVK